MKFSLRAEDVALPVSVRDDEEVSGLAHVVDAEEKTVCCASRPIAQWLARLIDVELEYVRADPPCACGHRRILHNHTPYPDGSHPCNTILCRCLDYHTKPTPHPPWPERPQIFSCARCGHAQTAHDRDRDGDAIRTPCVVTGCDCEDLVLPGEEERP